MEPPDEPPVPTISAPAAGAVTSIKAPVFIGAILVMAVASAFTWSRRAEINRVEVKALEAAVSEREAQGAKYRLRLEGFRWRARQIRAWANAQATEPVRTWALRRAGLFDAFVAQLDPGTEAARFEKSRAEIAALAAKGETASAKALASRLPRVEFPSPAKLIELQRKIYLTPLVALSRQDPQAYKALHEQEPEAAKDDVASLRADLADAGGGGLTPGQMAALELLAAVSPAGDPALADWSTLATIDDFIEQPDAPATAAWRQAQQALRAGDLPTAVVQMQSILRTKVRTRAAFRAAYGWALIQHRPDLAGEAYPYLQEASAAGDSAARKWVANEDLANGRLAQALRGFEAGLHEGDPAAVAPILKIYGLAPAMFARDAVNEAGTLQRILAGKEPSPLAALYLGRMHETGRGVVVSPHKALDYYRWAASHGLVAAMPELARCAQHGIGMEANVDQALAWASQAYAAGERGKSIGILEELLLAAPAPVAAGLQAMFEQESVVASGHGYTEKRLETQAGLRLKGALARYLDAKGQHGLAAKYYAQSGKGNQAIALRFAELTSAHRCKTCAGSGQVPQSIACLACGGNGTFACGHCDGRGNIMFAGAPPCRSCLSRGTMMQDGRVVQCPGCEGTGKGKDTVTKKTCVSCVQGRIACTACKQGLIEGTKECPDCRGQGSRALADR